MDPAKVHKDVTFFNLYSLLKDDLPGSGRSTYFQSQHKVILDPPKDSICINVS